MTVTIRLLDPQQVAEAKHLILSIAARTLEPDSTFEAFVERHGHGLVDVDDYRAQYSAPAGRFLVVMDGERLVGTAAIRRIDDATAELRRLWLLEAYHGQGIGYRLTRQLLDFARAAGYRRVRLTTDAGQDRALRLYRGLGFTFIEAYGQEKNGLFMELTLEA